MTKEPTLAECVEVLREMHAFAESVNDLREAKAFSRAIEVCERVQKANYETLAAELSANAREFNPDNYAVDLWDFTAKAALAWARGER